MRKSSLFPRCAGVLLILVMAPSMAHAYIDPGNGAYMVQALFTLVGAVFFYVRHPIRAFKACWRWILNRGRQGPIALAPEAVSDRTPDAGDRKSESTRD